ncbi:retrovirus-related pol polyprotein from transposon TNT 1-94 [Tanacetum coccineum]
MEDEIFFNQSKYIKKMLKKFGLEDSKPTKMLMSTEIKLTKDDEADSVDSSEYRVSTTRCLELLHLYLFGPSALWSYEGNLYTLVIVDDYSRMEHGREFDNEVQFGEFCNANGITHNFSARRTPQSNGVVERKDWTL